MAWPAEETPTSGGVWLECNGQTIDAKYARLRELVGDHTPNYQGVFLRGYGSQNVNTFQGFDELAGGYKNQTFSSGSLGTVQTDTTRPFVFASNKQLVWDDFEWSMESNVLSNSFSGVWDGFDMNPWYGTSYSPTENNRSSGYNLGSPVETFHETIWALKRPPKKYQLNGSNCSGGKSCSGSSLSLSESEDTDSGRYVNIWGSNWSATNLAAIPTDSEIRPVNVAVRYFIKAR